MLRLRSLLAPALALTALAAACDDGADPASGVRFELASAAQREAALRAAVAGPALGAFTIFRAEIDASQTGCPVLTEENGAVVLTGNGCSAGETVWHGRAVAKNVPTFEGAPDPSAPMELTFQKFGAQDADGTLIFDGSFSQSNVDGESPYDTVAALTLDDGVAVRIDASLHCAPSTAGMRCTAAAGARGEIVGVGGFDIAMDTTSGEAGMTGVVTLRGADELRIDLAAVDGDGCTPYTIDGDLAGRICDDGGEQPPLPPEPPAHDVLGYAIGCGDTLDLTAYVTPGAEKVDFVIAEASTVDVIELAPGAVHGETEQEWNAVLVPGQDTPFTCDGTFLEHGLRIRATFPGGITVCATYGDPGELILQSMPCDAE
jgi:hypothetical protein